MVKRLARDVCGKRILRRRRRFTIQPRNVARVGFNRRMRGRFRRSNAQAVAKISREFDEVAQLGNHFRGGFAECELRFEQKTGEGRVEFAVEQGGSSRAGSDLVVGAAGERCSYLTNSALGAGDDEVELQNRSGSSVLVKEVGGFRIGRGDGLF